jgi:hypothetical protein
MDDERSMILKMLSEGKITVEEADALLDVIKEAEEPEEPAGFTPKGEAAEADARLPDDESAAHEESADRRDRGHRKGPRGHAFTFGIDFGNLKDTLRETMGSVNETMKGVKETIRAAFEGLEGFDIGEEISRAMGRIRAEAERDLSIESDGATGLTIANKWGDLKVTGTDEDVINATARITAWAGEDDVAQAAIDAIDLAFRRDGDQLVLDCAEKPRRGVRIDYDITVPRGMGVTVSTASGDLWLEELSGSQTANTMSGDINVATLGSTSDDVQTIQTASGDVVAAALTGEVTLSSASGDVMIDGFSGVLRVSTQSGDIAVRDGHGPIQLKSMSGDIEARLTETGDGECSLSTVSGDIDLRLPTNAAFTVSARTTSGTVSAPIELADEHRSDNALDGDLNGGGNPLKLSSVSGDLGISVND